MYTTTKKVQNFFEYLIGLNDLVGKVVRHYKEFDKNWFLDELEGVEGVYLFDECQTEDTLLEIHRLDYTSEELLPPKPPAVIDEWIRGNVANERQAWTLSVKREVAQETGETVIEYFADDPERVLVFEKWKKRWNRWSQKVKGQKLYEEFFRLIQRFEKEGESIELVHAMGMLCWKHKEVGVIQHPLITVKLQLDYDQDRRFISAKWIEPEPKIEMGMLNGIQLPNYQQVNELVQSVTFQQRNQAFSSFFQQFIHLIDANGQYIDQPEGGYEAKEFPVLYQQSFFALRKKSFRIIREDLINIREGIERRQIEVTPVLKALVGDRQPTVQHERSTSADKHDFLTNQLYFPLEANEQQKEIVWRLERQNGVTIQGPPGTGKTHTIANLVSHYLAHGKRILITSQKEGPLRVLKNMIPAGIRDLCVPVLGGGRESLQEIEQSIRMINEKLGSIDLDQLEAQIKRDEDEFDQSKRREQRLKNQLKRYAEKEGSPLNYQGELLLRHEVARRLANTEIPYDWIKDDIPIDAIFPLTEAEFEEFCQLKSNLQPADLILNEKHLPHVGTHIRNTVEFEQLVKEGQQLERYLSVGKKVVSKYQLERDRKTIQHLYDQIHQITQQVEWLTDERYQALICEFKAGGTREERWRTMINEMSTQVKELLPLYYELVTHVIRLPNKPLRIIEEDLQIAKERLGKGKQPNFFFYLGKGKTTKYLFEEPVLDEEPVQNEEDLALLQSYVKYQRLRVELARVFNGYMLDVGLPPISPDEQRFPQLLDDRVKQLRRFLQVMDRIKAFMGDVGKSPLSRVNFYSADLYLTLKEEFTYVLGYIDYEEWNKKFQEECKRIEQQAVTKQAHPIWKDFVNTFQAKDIHKWASLLHLLADLYLKKDQVYRFYHLLKKIKSLLPLTAQNLEQTVGKVEPFLQQVEEAFEYRKLQTWVDETKGVHYEKIKQQIDQERNRQKELILRIVSQLTWKNQLQQITEEEKRALSAWKTNIKRYGKGTGKYAHTYLLHAREEMKKAQTAIPVWIMPVNQVLENFPVTNHKFDIIIFDESSQCDLYSINVLLRGKKIIVVGDDEQISPQSIGTRLEDVQDLKKRYLSGIPNANLFDGNISLYEMAEQIFPKEGKIMLKEHFRCVPEIIQFSNDLSYGGQMIPLRLPLEHEKIEPPVVAIKVDEGYNDERMKDINRPEMVAIVSDIKKMVHDPTYDGQTFGVISLQGYHQANLLETEIRKAIGEKEFNLRRIICGNPYTLQGDERDIIFLSMVVAPNRRFMVLDQPQYKQRFNVAASRARNQMRLYHSVDLDELSPRDLRYRLLSYCQHPTRLIERRENLESACESPFERDVLRMILARGYQVMPQVQVGGYRIDFVIDGIRDRLAVECDGEAWHGPEKFEADLQRQESLERAGWKFWRIRGREFYLDREQAMKGLWETLEGMGIEPNLRRKQVTTGK